MKALPVMCKDSQEHLNKIVYILAQLLQLEDQEYNIAASSLKLIYKDFPQQVVKALFLFITNSTEVNVREKCLTFIIKTLLPTSVNGSKDEIEDEVIEESKKLLAVRCFCISISHIIHFLFFSMQTLKSLLLLCLI